MRLERTALTPSVEDLGELLSAHDPPGIFTVEPWAVPERGLRPRAPGSTESLFALSNGHIGLRGNLDEGEPHGEPGHQPERLLREASRSPTRRAATATPRRGRH